MFGYFRKLATQIYFIADKVNLIHIQNGRILKIMSVVLDKLTAINNGVKKIQADFLALPSVAELQTRNEQLNADLLAAVAKDGVSQAEIADLTARVDENNAEMASITTAVDDLGTSVTDLDTTIPDAPEV